MRRFYDWKQKKTIPLLPEESEHIEILSMRLAMGFEPEHLRGCEIIEKYKKTGPSPSGGDRRARGIFRIKYNRRISENIGLELLPETRPKS